VVKKPIDLFEHLQLVIFNTLAPSEPSRAWIFLRMLHQA